MSVIVSPYTYVNKIYGSINLSKSSFIVAAIYVFSVICILPY